MGQVLVELFVLLLGDLLVRARPERTGLVDRLEGELLLLLFPVLTLDGLLDLELDRVVDEIRVTSHQLAELPALGKVGVILLEMQDHRCSGLLPLGRLDGEAFLPFGTPLGCLLAASGTTHDLDLVGDQVATVESHAKLTDQVRVAGLLGFLQLLDELARPRTGDRAQVLGKSRLPHTNTVVDDRQGAVGFVWNQTNPGRVILG